MPHSYEHIGTQQSSVGDELYNLTQLAEVSIVYFKHHTVIDDRKTFEKVSPRVHEIGFVRSSKLAHGYTCVPYRYVISSLITYTITLYTERCRRPR